MKKIKSKLQKSLEEKGWEFLTNESIKFAWDKKGNPQPRFSPRSDEEIKLDYSQREAFKEVKIEKAYDIYGNALPEMRAVYVKRA